MKSHLETLCHLVLQQLAAEPHFVQQFAAEPRFVQQLLARCQPAQADSAHGPSGQAQALLNAGGGRQLRVHLGGGGAAAALDTGFSLRLFAGPRPCGAAGGRQQAVCELDGTVAVDLLIPSDGGEILYHGQLLSGGLQTAPEASEWRDGVVSYFRFDEAERQHLLITAGASAMFVQDWRNADLGIHLREANTVVTALAAGFAVAQAERVPDFLAAANDASQR